MSRALRLMWITDGCGDAERIVDLAMRMIRGGVRAIQVREASLPAGELLSVCESLARLMEPVAGVVQVNDRADVAASAGLGVHLPAASLPVGLARDVVGPNALVGCSVHDEAELETAVVGGADYVVVSPVFSTPSKPGAATLGIAGAAHLSRRSPVPAIWLGGMTAETTRTAAVESPFGVAVMSALTSEPEETASRILRALEGGSR